MRTVLIVGAICASVLAGAIVGVSRHGEHVDPPRPRYGGANFAELSPAQNAEISFMLGLLDDVRLKQSGYLDAARLTPAQAIARGIVVVGDRNAETNLRRMTSAWLADLCEAGLLSSEQIEWFGEVLARIMFDTEENPRIRLAVRNRAVEQRLFARPHVALGVSFIDHDRAITEWKDLVRSGATKPASSQPTTVPATQAQVPRDRKRFSGARFAELTESQNTDITIVLGTLDDVRFGEVRFLDPLGVSAERAIDHAIAIVANKQSEIILRRLTSAWIADLCQARLLDEAKTRTFADVLVTVMLDRDDHPRIRVAARNRVYEQSLLEMPGVRAAATFVDADPSIIQWRDEIAHTENQDAVSTSRPAQ